jgi:hypothetical protein
MVMYSVVTDWEVFLILHLLSIAEQVVGVVNLMPLHFQVRVVALVASSFLCHDHLMVLLTHQTGVIIDSCVISLLVVVVLHERVVV